MKIVYMSILAFIVSANVLADNRIEHVEPEKVITEVIEIFGKNIRLSNDGTGIVTNVKCKVCKSSTLKITANTKAYLGKEKTGIIAAKKAKGNGVAVVRFNVDTGEVIYVRW